jgi:hypothetical protein
MAIPFTQIPDTLLVPGQYQEVSQPATKVSQPAPEVSQPAL